MAQQKKPFYLPESWLDADGRLCYPAHVLESIPEESEPASSHATSRRGTFSRQSSDPHHTAAKFVVQAGSSCVCPDGSAEQFHTWDSPSGRNAGDGTSCSRENCVLQTQGSTRAGVHPLGGSQSTGGTPEDRDLVNSDGSVIFSAASGGDRFASEEAPRAAEGKGFSGLRCSDEASLSERSQATSSTRPSASSAGGVHALALSTGASHSLGTSGAASSAERSRASGSACAFGEQWSSAGGDAPGMTAGTGLLTRQSLPTRPAASRCLPCPSRESQASFASESSRQNPPSQEVECGRSGQWQAPQSELFLPEPSPPSSEVQLEAVEHLQKTLRGARTFLEKGERAFSDNSRVDSPPSVSRRGTTGILRTREEEKLPALSSKVHRPEGISPDIPDVGERLLLRVSEILEGSEEGRPYAGGMPSPDPADQAAGFLGRPSKEQSQTLSTSVAVEKFASPGTHTEERRSLTCASPRADKIVEARPSSALRMVGGADSGGKGEVDRVFQVPFCSGQNQEDSFPYELGASDTGATGGKSPGARTPQLCYRRHASGEGDVVSAWCRPSALPPLLWLALRTGELSRFLDFSGNLRLSAASKPLRALLSPWSSSVCQQEAQESQLTTYEASGPGAVRATECTEGLDPSVAVLGDWVGENAYGSKEGDPLSKHLEDERQAILTLCATDEIVSSPAWLRYYSTLLSWSHLRVTASWARLTDDQVETILSRANSLLELDVFLSVDSVQRLRYAGVAGSAPLASSSPPPWSPVWTSDIPGLCPCGSSRWREKLMHCLVSAFACLHNNRKTLRAFRLHVGGPHASQTAETASDAYRHPWLPASCASSAPRCEEKTSVASEPRREAPSFPALRLFCLRGSFGLWCLLTAFPDLSGGGPKEESSVSGATAREKGREERLLEAESATGHKELPPVEANVSGGKADIEAACRAVCTPGSETKDQRDRWKPSLQTTSSLLDILSGKKGNRSWMALEAPGLEFLDIADRCGWFDWNVFFPVLSSRVSKQATVCRRSHPARMHSSSSFRGPCLCAAASQASGFDLRLAKETLSVLRARAVDFLLAAVRLSASARSSLRVVSFDFGPPAAPRRAQSGGATAGACARLSCTCCLSFQVSARGAAGSDRERRSTGDELQFPNVFRADASSNFHSSVSREDAAQRWCGALSEILLLSEESFLSVGGLVDEEEQTRCGLRRPGEGPSLRHTSGGAGKGGGAVASATRRQGVWRGRAHGERRGGRTFGDGEPKKKKRHTRGFGGKASYR